MKKLKDNRENKLIMKEIDKVSLAAKTIGKYLDDKSEAGLKYNKLDRAISKGFFALLDKEHRLATQLEQEEDDE